MILNYQKFAYCKCDLKNDEILENIAISLLLSYTLYLLALINVVVRHGSWIVEMYINIYIMQYIYTSYNIYYLCSTNI